MWSQNDSHNSTQIASGESRIGAKSEDCSRHLRHPGNCINIRSEFFTMKMEILLELTSNKLMERFNTTAGNLVKGLRKLNLSYTGDLTDSKANVNSGQWHISFFVVLSGILSLIVLQWHDGGFNLERIRSIIWDLIQTRLFRLSYLEVLWISKGCLPLYVAHMGWLKCGWSELTD
ncbi:hypothetical protein Tco_0629085 [Tanacetum coccineum]|uniref:Uncharacterized protein n=1 Tax=Tanacetum coccineum TaxID=301880 RepID=A0ABQ4WS61_9ASTR